MAAGPYTIGWQMNWNTFKDDNGFKMYIHDTDSGLSGLLNYDNYEAMTPATQDPVSWSCIDNDENKFTPQRAKKCTIQYQSSLNIPFYTFAIGADTRFLVEVLGGVTEQEIFKGYLVQEGNSCPFLPHPQIVTLTATDNLKTLSKVPLTDDSGDNPTGNYSLLELIRFC